MYLNLEENKYILLLYRKAKGVSFVGQNTPFTSQTVFKKF